MQPENPALPYGREFRHALLYMAQHAHEDIGIADIARATRVPPGVVTRMFELRLRETPAQVLFDLRVERAHAELLAHPSDDPRICPDVAAKWHLVPYNRFRAHYERCYGVVPEATVQHAQRAAAQDVASLVTHLQCDTTEPRQAAEFLRHAYGDATSMTGIEVDQLRLSADIRRANGFSIDVLAWRGTLHLTGHAAGRVCVIEVLEGAVRTEALPELLAGDLAVLHPALRLSAAGEQGARVGLVSIARHTLQRVAAESTGIGPGEVALTPGGPVDEMWARHWKGTLRHILRDVLGVPVAAGSRTCLIEAHRLLAVATLNTFPNATHTLLRGPHPQEPPTAVRRAMRYIEENAHRPIEVADIAEVARIGPRSLQAAFRRHLHTTPTEYLHDLRFARAHEDLLRGDPTTGDSVAAIATRCGFTHHGRFARAYRDRYGRNPRDTLHAPRPATHTERESP